ncbi:MAG: hypothetical protein ABI758_05515 [Candidatus Woesebacteria bacterium]
MSKQENLRNEHMKRGHRVYNEHLSEEERANRARPEFVIELREFYNLKDHTCYDRVRKELKKAARNWCKDLYLMVETMRRFELEQRPLADALWAVKDNGVWLLVVYDEIHSVLLEAVDPSGFQVTEEGKNVRSLLPPRRE